MSSEKPIIFTDWSVRAILENRKTQTRRAVKPPHAGLLYDFGDARVDGWTLEGVNPLTGTGKGEQYLHVAYTHPDDGWPESRRDRTYERVLCPYGSPGGHLWVQEAWDECADKCRGYFCLYRAGMDQEEMKIWDWRRPSKMPCEYSRLTLEITAIRVERLQTITYQEACAEGCGEPDVLNGQERMINVRHDFINKWNAIHQKDGHAWESNPWAWVIEFQKL